MSNQTEGDVTAWLRDTGPIIDEAETVGDVDSMRAALKRELREQIEESIAASLFGPVQKWGQHQPEFPLPEYRAPVSGRDELEALIRANATPYREDTWFTEPDSDLPKILAGIILADGWRKP